MLQKYNTYRILRLFFDSPKKSFQLREISRILKLGLPSVKNHLEELEKEGFVEKKKGNIYDNYVAIREEKFKTYKKTDIIIRLFESGLIDYIDEEVSPDVIILFGSASRGEDIEQSDIDIFVLAKEKEINLDKFEKILKRKINVLFEHRIKNIPEELLNNISNGIVLRGYLKIK